MENTLAASEAATTTSLVLDQADRLLQQFVTKERLGRADRGEPVPEIWEAVTRAGIHLALLPDEAGGFGLSAGDALLLIRRAGYFAAPIPLGETMVATALWTASGGSADGVWSLAADADAKLAPVDGGYRLNGELRRVPWGAAADHVLIHVADSRGGHLIAAPRSAGAAVTPRKNLANEPRDTITFEGFTLSESAVRPAPEACREGLQAFGALIRAQQMAGAMERCLDFALAYANERQQFGRTIGKFQAIQHMLAEAAGHCAAASAAADMANDAWGSAQFAFAVGVAKARVGEAAGKVAAICHQVHGAMGFTQEHPLHFATRRLWSWRDEFGGEAFWEERIGRLVSAQGGAALWDRIAQAAGLGSVGRG